MKFKEGQSPTTKFELQDSTFKPSFFFRYKAPHLSYFFFSTSFFVPFLTHSFLNKRHTLSLWQKDGCDIHPSVISILVTSFCDIHPSNRGGIRRADFSHEPKIAEIEPQWVRMNLRGFLPQINCIIT